MKVPAYTSSPAAASEPGSVQGKRPESETHTGASPCVPAVGWDAAVPAPGDRDDPSSLKGEGGDISSCPGTPLCSGSVLGAGANK